MVPRRMREAEQRVAEVGAPPWAATTVEDLLILQPPMEGREMKREGIIDVELDALIGSPQLLLLLLLQLFLFFNFLIFK